MNLQELLLLFSVFTALLAVLCFLIMGMIENFQIVKQYVEKRLVSLIHYIDTLAAQFWYQYGAEITSKLSRAIHKLICRIMKGGK